MITAGLALLLAAGAAEASRFTPRAAAHPVEKQATNERAAARHIGDPPAALASDSATRFPRLIATDLRRTRAAAAPAADPTLSLTAAMGWAWSHDAGRRLAGARAGTDDASAAWTFGYGKADELLFAQQSTQGLASFTSGPEGRLLERSTPDGSEAFLYDLEGRRIEDGRFLLTHDWRGRLVQVDVTPGSGVKGPAGDALDGHRILYTYDAVGRLLTRTHHGAPPAGGSDHERPFIARRAFTWDGDTLAAEAGLNFHDQVIWRAQYLPGPSGLDDSPQVLLDTELLTDHPRQAVYAYLRDELGSVIGLLDEGSTSGADPPRLLARYLYTPYGEAHLETGPELLRIELDASTTQVGGQQQTAAPGESVPGALRVETTLPLASEPFTEGLRLERYGAGTLEWVALSQSDLAIGHDEAKPEALLIVPLSGWSVGQRYRITLLPTLEDGYGRRIQLPREEHSGVVVLLEVPGDGTTPPAYLRDFELLYDSAAAAAATLCEPHEDGSCRPRLPGGQPSLFQGLWVDPLTGYAHARQRVLDTRTGVWLQEDPIGPWNSENLFAFTGWAPQRYRDPQGLWAEDLVAGLPSLGLGVYSLVSDIEEGHWGLAAVDALGIVADAVAVALPAVPGGAGLAIRTSRGVATAARAIQVADQAVAVGQGALAAAEAYGEGKTGWAAFYAATAALGAKQETRRAPTAMAAAARTSTGALPQRLLRMGNRLEKRAKEALSARGESIIETQFRQGAARRGFDFASYTGSGTEARLIINEVKNVSGRVKGKKFSMFGVNRTQTLEENLREARRAIINGVSDEPTRAMLLEQLRNKSYTIRLIGNAGKGTRFAADVKAKIKTATQVTTAIDEVWFR